VQKLTRVRSGSSLHFQAFKQSYIQSIHFSSPHLSSILHFPQSICISRTPLRNPPSPQRQRLQLYSSRLNITPEGHHPNNHTDNIHNVIAIATDIARAAALDTHVLCLGGSAGEGFRDQGPAKRGWEFVAGCWWDAGCDGKCVDELEDEEAGESAA